MTVPSPSVLPVLQPGATNIGRFIGALPGLDPGDPLRVNLTFFNASIRSSARFRENMRVTMESGNEDLGGPTPTAQPLGNSQFITFFDTPGQPNEYMEISGLTFEAGTEIFILQVENIHTTIR